MHLLRYLETNWLSCVFLGNCRHEVERLIRCEGFAAYQVLTNSECVPVLSRE